MSFEIGSLGPTEPLTEAAQSERASPPASTADFPALLKAATEPAVQVELDSSFPTSPPPEVTRAIGVASTVYEHLNASGKHVHFSVSQPAGGVSVELRDMAGNPLSTISPSEALRIAGGESLN